jgi:fermentation-respiration switch protein FrsA (DUF1100 family)
MKIGWVRRLKRLAMTLAIGVVALLLSTAAAIRHFENSFIYFPPRYPEGFIPAHAFPLPVEDVWLTTQDNVRLNAWYLTSPGSGKALLWFHGNAENIGHGLGQAVFYSRLGVNVLAVDYRGYGRSEGSPNETGVYRDADAAYDYLVQVRHVRPKNIIVFGHSLGGAVAIDLASRRECGGLIVESSFTSVRDMARRTFRIPLFEYLPKSRFDSLAKIGQVQAPILILHGTRDEIVPFSMGQRLFTAAPEPKFFFPVEGAGHNDVIEMGGDQLFQRFESFLNSLVGGRLAVP